MYRRQNQALSALLFLSASARTKGRWINEVERAKRPKPIPAVLTRDAVHRLSSRCAAECAGDGRGDIGGEDLLWRFLRRRFFGRRRGDAGRGMDQATVFDDFLDLSGVERLVFQQRFGDGFEFVAVFGEGFFGGLVSVIEKTAH